MADRTTKELVKEAIFKGVKSYKELSYEDKQLLVQHMSTEIYNKPVKDLTINEKAFLEAASVVLAPMFYVEQNKGSPSRMFSAREINSVAGTVGWWDGETEKENEPHLTDFINQ